jgi:hypothetical protein
MKLNKNEKMVLKKYLDSIIICICSFISEDEMKIYVEKSQTILELLEHISNSLKTKELDGWVLLQIIRSYERLGCYFSRMSPLGAIIQRGS